MRKSLAVCLFSLLLPSLLATYVSGIVIDEEALILIMRRGDANSDGVVNVSDPVFLNSFLFGGGHPPPCMNQADANNDGQVDVSDSVYLLTWLYQGGSAPPAPGPYNSVCTLDDEPYPGCAVNPCK